MTDIERIDSIVGAAGAGFRLSLVLNAVKIKMQNADVEIQMIAKGISDFSLMLKQVARTMEEGGVTATPLAITTVFSIKDHAERVFEEFKSMTELAQVRDDKGHLTEIGIGQRVTWCFKKQKVPYLLGQLDYLKLNLTIMLQILQLGKLLGGQQDRPSEKTLMQERAEVQNVIVLQHWSLEDLKSLYGVANDEARHDAISPSQEEPPPCYDAPSSGEIRLQVAEAPKKEDHSQALVSYKEQPIQELDASLHQALALENQTLEAPVPDIVNHLLQEWTQPPEPQQRGPRSIMTQRPPSKQSNGHKYRPHYSSEEEDDTTESEYERSDDSRRGYYIEGPRNGVKNVRFKARVEDDVDEDERRPKRSTQRHILRSDDDISSDSESSISPVARRSHGRDRRDSDPKYDSSPQQSSDRRRRPYAVSRDHPSEDRNARPGSSRGAPPQPMQPQHQQPPQQPPRPIPIQTSSHSHQQQYHNTQQPPSAGLRPPQYGPPPSGPQRMPSNGQYIPSQYMGPSPQASPQPPPGSFFARQPLMPLPQNYAPPPNAQQPPRRTPAPPQNRSHRADKESRRHEKQMERAEKDKKSASRNLKTGLGLGAAAAGLMELLSGLDGI